VNSRSILSCRSALWLASAGKAQLASTSARTLGTTMNLTNLHTHSSPDNLSGPGGVRARRITSSQAQLPLRR
jgi:hypothetical protein